jgi:hypothetical protein
MLIFSETTRDCWSVVSWNRVTTGKGRGCRWRAERNLILIKKTPRETAAFCRWIQHEDAVAPAACTVTSPTPSRHRNLAGVRNGRRLRPTYSIRSKINAILAPSTENNARCEMTKIPFVLHEKDLAIDLSYMWETSRFSCLLWLIS